MRYAHSPRRAAIASFTVLAASACGPQQAPDDAGLDVVDAGPQVARCTVTSHATLPCDGDAAACVSGPGTAVSCSPTLRTYATAAGPAGAGHVLVGTLRNDESGQWDTHLVPVDADGGAATVVQNPTGAGGFDGGPYNNAEVTLAAQSYDAPALFWQGDTARAAYAMRYVGDGSVAEVTLALGDGGFAALQRGAAAPDGTLYAWGRTNDGWVLATRDPASGTWSNATVPASGGFPGAITVGPDGRAYTAQWSPDSDYMSRGTLTLSIAGGAPTTVLTDTFTLGSTRTLLAVGRGANGAPEPVFAYDSYGAGVFMAVPDGAGGYSKITVPQPGVADTCPHGAVHLSCDECHAPVCTVVGDAIYDVALVTGPDGAVWLASLLVHYDESSSVNAVPETAGGQTIGCDCQITPMQNNTHATEIVFARVSTGAAPALEPRARMAVDPGVRAISLAQRDGVFHVLAADYADTTNVVAVHTALSGLP